MSIDPGREAVHHIVDHVHPAAGAVVHRRGGGEGLAGGPISVAGAPGDLRATPGVAAQTCPRR